MTTEKPGTEMAEKALDSTLKLDVHEFALRPQPSDVILSTTLRRLLRHLLTLLLILIGPFGSS